MSTELEQDAVEPSTPEVPKSPLLGLPSEVLGGILECVDLPSLEVVKGAHPLLAHLVQGNKAWERRFYQLFPCESLAPQFAPQLTPSGWFRQQVLQRFRPRFDGLYISRCTYRRRLAEGRSFVDKRTVVDITYFRLLRLLPEGAGVMLRCDPEYVGEKAVRPSTKAVDFMKGVMPSSSGGRLVLSQGEEYSSLRQQAIEVEWRFLEHGGRDADGPELRFHYKDSRTDWVGRLRISHMKRGVLSFNSKLLWKRYCCWNSALYADFRSRQRSLLLLEREAPLRRELSTSLARPELEALLEPLAEQVQEEELASAAALAISDPFLGGVPLEILEDLRLNEHFVPFAFKNLKSLAHLF